MARPRRAARAYWRTAARAALWLAIMLPGCSGLALPQEAAPAQGPDPAFNRLIADRLKSFKDYKSFSAFEISDFRWVHTVKGWAWLACVRVQERGRANTFAFFISDRTILDYRLAVEVDACGARSYQPFASAGTAAPAAPAPGARVPGVRALDPLH